jgi:hypothetical protein
LFAYDPYHITFGTVPYPLLYCSLRY